MSILIVEDDLPFRELIQAALEPRPVRFATSYAEAMKLIAEKLPRAVILDLALHDSTPVMTIERINEIKTRSKNVPVIVITGNPDYRLHNAALRAGARAVLSKDHEFFETLNVVLEGVGEKWECASQPTVEAIERTVGKIVGH